MTLEEGIRKERQKFREEGKAIRKREFAKLMLQDGEPLAKIKRYTGFPSDVIKKLKAEINDREAPEDNAAR